MVQCAAAELPKIRVPGANEATCLDLNCQETAPCRPSLLKQLWLQQFTWSTSVLTLLTAFHCRLWLPRESGCRGWGWMRSTKWMWLAESRGRSTKVAGGNRRSRLEVCVTVLWFIQSVKTTISYTMFGESQTELWKCKILPENSICS